MKGDFSRIAFDRRKHYVGVLYQQGRVWLDSDGNEDVLDRLDQLQQETYDIVGDCGVPFPGTAFQISPGTDPAHPEDFAIGGGDDSKGRAYVQGVLCRMDSPTTYFQQPDLPDPPTIPINQTPGETYAIIYLEAWRRLITYLEDPSIADVALGGPDTATRIKIVSQVKAVLVPPGTTCADLRNFLPTDNGTLTTLQPHDTQPTDLCSLPDPANYTGRENHLYRIEVHTGGDVLNRIGAPVLSLFVALSQNAAAGSTALNLARALTTDQIASIQRWGNVLTLNDDDGRAEQIDIATVTSTGSVLVLASPLTNSFTVGKHATVLGLGEFKWSRDNAIYAVGVTNVADDRQTLTLASLGRDQASALRGGDIVEVCDDASELGPARGHLTYISGDPDPDLLKVTIADPLPPRFRLNTDPNPPSTDRHLVLRRWDGRGIARDTYDDAATPDMNLGNGVHIQFGGGNLRPGDYWNFVARSADGSIQSLAQASPKGIVRYYCPLALVRWAPLSVGSPPTSPPPVSNVVMQVLEDCRNLFNPLTEIPGADPGMHIVAVFALNSATGARAPLINDQVFTASSISGGIDIVCDNNVDPASVSRPTCSLTIEIPFAAAGQAIATPVVAYQTLTFVGTVNGRGRIISWRPAAAANQVLAQLGSLVTAPDKGVLCRLILQGNFIWSLGNPRLYLDGDDFGVPNPRLALTTISLPTGDKRRGGVFQTWFWLTPDAPTPPKLTDKTTDKTTDTAGGKQKEKITEKVAEKLKDKTKDRDKTRDKVREKIREKVGEKVQDKIKDRDLAPLRADLSTDLFDRGHPVLQDPANLTAEGRAFITPDERPEVGKALLEERGKKGVRR
jgi:hypothetical protein